MEYTDEERGRGGTSTRPTVVCVRFHVSTTKMFASSVARIFAVLVFLLRVFDPMSSAASDHECVSACEPTFWFGVFFWLTPFQRYRRED